MFDILLISGDDLMNTQKIYLCIDLKSFYASVECVERGLDPFEINLVVANPDRGDGAITLAATPAIKKIGVPSRGRIHEIPKNIEYIIAKPRMHLYMEYSAKIYSIFLKFVSRKSRMFRCLMPFWLMLNSSRETTYFGKLSLIRS